MNYHLDSIDNSLKNILHHIKNRNSLRPGLTKIVNNVGWLFFGKLLRIGVGLVLTVWLARYLGPDQFGLLNYVTALVGMFSVLASLGLNGTLVKNLVNEPQQSIEVIGTAFILRLASGAFALVLLMVVGWWLRPGDQSTAFLVFVLGFTLIFRSSEVFNYWFEAHVDSKYVVWVESFAYAVVSALVIAFILNEYSLIAIIYLLTSETVLVAALISLVFLLRESNHWRLKFEISRAKSILSESWPLLLSGISIIIYMRIDQIMLGQMIGNEAVGLYSIAVRTSEAWYMIPTVIVASLFPSILKARKVKISLYNNRIQKILNLMTAATFLFAIFVTISADWIVDYIFGIKYHDAASILRIHIWAGVFVSLGVVGSKWYLSEGLQRLYFYRVAGGAIVNIGLNFLLIPSFSAIGAAVSTVISYAFAAYLFDACSAKTLYLFRAKSRALFLWPVNLVKSHV